MQTLSRTLIALLLMTAPIILCSCAKQKRGQSRPASQSSSVPSASAPLLVDPKGEPGKLQSVDVISGKPINPSIYADYEGYRVYFCCPTSRSDFQQNAQRYLQAIKLRGILLEPTPAPGKTGAVPPGSVEGSQSTKGQPGKPQMVDLGTPKAVPSGSVPLLVDAKGEPGKRQ